MSVVALVVAVQTLVLGYALWRAARDAPAVEPPTGGRLAAIAGLLLAQAGVTYLFDFVTLPAVWRDGRSTLPGLVWVTQAARVALLLIAGRLWYGMSRDVLGVPRRPLVLMGALLAIGFGGAMLPVIGAARGGLRRLRSVQGDPGPRRTRPHPRPHRHGAGGGTRRPARGTRRA